MNLFGTWRLALAAMLGTHGAEHLPQHLAVDAWRLGLAALRLAPLHTLELGRNHVGPRGARALADVLRLPPSSVLSGWPSYSQWENRQPLKGPIGSL